MPKKLDWSFLYEKIFKNDQYFKSFCATELQSSISKNNKSNCTICDYKNENHRMEMVSLICNAKSCYSTNLCPVRHKATRCLKSSNYKPRCSIVRYAHI